LKKDLLKWLFQINPKGVNKISLNGKGKGFRGKRFD
jgi:hypothetical protein